MKQSAYERMEQDHILRGERRDYHRDAHIFGKKDRMMIDIDLVECYHSIDPDIQSRFQADYEIALDSHTQAMHQFVQKKIKKFFLNEKLKIHDLRFESTERDLLIEEEIEEEESLNRSTNLIDQTEMQSRSNIIEEQTKIKIDETRLKENEIDASVRDKGSVYSFGNRKTMIQPLEDVSEIKITKSDLSFGLSRQEFEGLYVYKQGKENKKEEQNNTETLFENLSKKEKDYKNTLDIFRKIFERIDRIEIDEKKLIKFRKANFQILDESNKIIFIIIIKQ